MTGNTTSRESLIPISINGVKTALPEDELVSATRTMEYVKKQELVPVGILKVAEFLVIADARSRAAWKPFVKRPPQLAWLEKAISSNDAA